MTNIPKPMNENAEADFKEAIEEAKKILDTRGDK